MVAAIDRGRHQSQRRGPERHRTPGQPNGFSHVLDRLNGQFLKATQTVKDLTWTKGIDQKTGRPIDYDPSRDVQVYAEGAESVADKNTHRALPVHQFSGRRLTASRPDTS